MLLRGRAGSRRSLHMPWVEVVRVWVRVRVRVGVGVGFGVRVRVRIKIRLDLVELMANPLLSTSPKKSLA